MGQEVSTAAEPESPEFLDLVLTKGRYVEDFAALLLRSLAPADHRFAVPVATHPFVQELAEEITPNTQARAAGAPAVTIL